MHFVIYSILKNKTLKDFNKNIFEDIFGKNYCNGCGDFEPKVYDLCDWFEIGGRWVDCLKAKQGVLGTPSWMYAFGGKTYAPKQNQFSVCEIKDLLDTGKSFEPYGFVIDDEYVDLDGNETRYNEILSQIRNHALNGVIVVVDCHM